MFKIFSHRTGLPFYMKALPVVPLGFSPGVPPDTAGVVGETDVEVEDMDVVGGQVERDAGVPDSPLTYGKVFGAIPRMSKAINTPVINSRIADVFGLPHLANSSDFKKVYSDGREVLR